MQTILGAGGAIGKELAKALKTYTNNIRLVSRNPEKINPTDEVVAADLLRPDELRKAAQGSDIIYLTAGLPYDAKIWQKQWPAIMTNVLAACKEQRCKLVFFDNIYMYDANHLNGMTEETPVNPPSEKGKVRARLAEMVMNEAKEGKIRALIARSADFYGPGIGNNSILAETVIKPLGEGKKANWLGSVSCRHSFTYTPDAGKATAMLGNTNDAYDKVWHLPTAADPLTGKEWIERIARELEVKPKYREVSKLLVRIMGWVEPIMSETVEMFYQYDRDYIFDSSKFEQHFDFKPTFYAEGIRETVKAHKNSS